MTNFKEDFHKREIDPRIIIRACMFYYKELDNHLKNVKHLSQEQIKYYADHLLESTLFLEQYASQIYDSLSDQEKAILDLAETKRNENLYKNKSGEPVTVAAEKEITNCINAANERYDRIHKESEDRVNNL